MEGIIKNLINGYLTKLRKALVVRGLSVEKIEAEVKKVEDDLAPYVAAFSPDTTQINSMFFRNKLTPTQIATLTETVLVEIVEIATEAEEVIVAVEGVVK